MIDYLKLLFVLIGGAVGTRARARVAGSTPKPLDLVNDRVIEAAIGTYSAVAEKARGSNDDPLVLHLISVTLLQRHAN